MKWSAAMEVRGNLAMAEETQVMNTIDDIRALPAGERAELIDGKMYRMEAPARVHQKVVGELFYQISSYIKANQGACEVYLSPFAVYISRDNHNYVEPDIVVVCDRDKLDDAGCQGAPDWIIEVLSPGSRKLDCSIKLFKYRAAGVREYWIVDPEKQTVRAYDFIINDYAEYTFRDKVPAVVYDDLVVDFMRVDIS